MRVWGLPVTVENPLRFWRLVIVISVFALTTAVASAAAAETSGVRVVVVPDETLELRAPSVRRCGDELCVSGWVARRPSSFGLLRSHLRIEALDGDGRVVQSQRATWAGELPTTIRFRQRAARFGARLSTRENVAAVRVAVAAD